MAKVCIIRKSWPFNWWISVCCFIVINFSTYCRITILYLLSYIYIYIYCYPQTDCFVVSQLFSVSRHVGRLKLGSKPAQLYVRLSIRPLSQQAYHVGKGIIRYYVAAAAFVCLQFILCRIPECSNRSKPAQLYVRLSIRPLSQQAYHVGKGIISYCVAAAAFVCLHFILCRIPECSIRSKSFALCEQQPKIPSPEC